MKVDLAKTMTQCPAYDGRTAKLYELENSNGMRVTFMDIGATWLSCKLPLEEGEKEVLLGVGDMIDFKKHTSYFGATIGRFANRIAGGRFNIGNKSYQTLLNQGENILHGGPDGFDKRRWDVADLSPNSISFVLISQDGDQGFPGELNAAVTYTLSDNNEVCIDYKATTDKPTPINLTNHAYFNLEDADLGSDCRTHKLKINARYYLPTDATGIPQSEFSEVNRTNFDFREPKRIGRDFMKDGEQKSVKGYDHSFIFKPLRDVNEPVAEIENSDGSVSMQVFTDKPAMQLYTGNWNRGTPRRNGGVYEDYSGIALETQLLPDAPNHPEWPQPDSIIYPGDTYHYMTKYKFFF